jgi:acetyltransferase-like isoleucine patch superfamily enzyme
MEIVDYLKMLLNPRTCLHGLRLMRFYAQVHVSEIGKVHMGKGSSIAPTATLRFGEHITIGSNTHVNHMCDIWASHEGNIRIGNDVLFGPKVHINSANHNFKKGQLIREQYGEHADVEIGNDVWLGAHVVVLPGVKIGEGSVVGAGSIITKDIPPYSVAVGSPAKVIKKRT